MDWYLLALGQLGLAVTFEQSPAHVMLGLACFPYLRRRSHVSIDLNAERQPGALPQPLFHLHCHLQPVLD